MTTKSKKDGFLTLLERQIREILRDKELSSVDRLKAVEAGARLLQVRHKIEGGEQIDGAFFRK